MLRALACAAGRRFHEPQGRTRREPLSERDEDYGGPRGGNDSAAGVHWITPGGVASFGHLGGPLQVAGSTYGGDRSGCSGKKNESGVVGLSRKRCSRLPP